MEHLGLQRQGPPDARARQREADAGVPHDRVLQAVAAGLQQIAEGVREADAAQDLEGLVGAGEVGLDVLDDAAHRLERGAAVLQRGGHLGSTGRSPRLRLQAMRAPRGSAAGPSTKAVRWLGQRQRRARVRAGHRPQQQRRVLHAARQRTVHAHRIPRVGRRHLRDATGRRAQPDDVAERGWVADAGAEIGPIGQRGHARGDGDRCAAAAAAGGAREIVRVAGRPEDGVEGLRAGAELGVFVLPMTIAPARRRRATTSVSAVGTWSRKIGDPYVVRIPGGVLEVLDGDGEAVEQPVARQRRDRRRRPSRTASSASRVTIALSAGLTASMRPQMRVHHLGARQLAVADRVGQPGRIPAPQFVVAHRVHLRAGVADVGHPHLEPSWPPTVDERESPWAAALLHAKLQSVLVMAATVHHTPLVYVESDIPEGVTLAEWRRSRRAVQARRASVLIRWAASCAGRTCARSPWPSSRT